MQKLYNKIFKIINKKRRKKLLMITVSFFLLIDQLFRKEIAIFMFKHKTKRLPSIFEYIFQLSIIEKIETRSKTRIIPISCTTTTAKQSIRFLGPKVWSNLPTKIKECTTMKNLLN